MSRQYVSSVNIEEGVVASSGSADANKLVALGSNGKLDSSVLPVASASVLGGIKQGTGFSIAEDGTSSVDTSVIIPAGAITMWSGATATIPSGWALCNGSNGTPDLRDRFVIGAGNIYSVGATGGEAQHTLTVEEMPSHNHQEYGTGIITGNHIYRGGGGQLGLSDDSTGYTGGGAAHNNLPPYYALAFIMKL